MNEDKLRSELGGGEYCLWMRSILELFESVLGKDFGHSDIVASMFILKHYRITLADGTVINNDDLNQQVWSGDAAFVATQLGRDAYHPDAWWKGEYGLHPKDTPEFESNVEQLVVRISKSPMVAGCEMIG
ncbi:MAG: hypothetical protein ACO1TE_05110 [Prosthecobacter sp.]